MGKKSLVIGFENVGRSICSLLESSDQSIGLFGILDKKFLYVPSEKETYTTYCEVKDLPELSDEVILVEIPDIIITTGSLSKIPEIFDYAKKNKIPILITSNDDAEDITQEDLEVIHKISEDIPISVYRYLSSFENNFVAEQTIDSAKALITRPAGYYNKADLEND